MNNVSKRALLNFVVDSAIAVAFLIAAVSGLVFLLPAGWLTLSGSSTSALGVEFATWRTLHDWTAVIMIAGVVLHTTLHWRWVTTMVRRLAGSGRGVARPAAPTVPATLSASEAVAAHLTEASAVTAPSDARSAVDVPERSGDKWDAGVAPGGTRRDALTRNAFLKRAGVVGAAAVVGGLVGRSVTGAAVSWLDGSPTNGSAAPATQDSTTGLGAGSDAGSSSDGAGAWGGDQSTQSGTVVTRVVIDSGRCTGCGHCLQACPSGVFAASGSQVVVSNADACRLCGGCAQVCQAGAITLNG